MGWERERERFRQNTGDLRNAGGGNKVLSHTTLDGGICESSNLNTENCASHLLNKQTARFSLNVPLVTRLSEFAWHIPHSLVPGMKTPPISIAQARHSKEKHGKAREYKARGSEARQNEAHPCICLCYSPCLASTLVLTISPRRKTHTQLSRKSTYVRVVVHYTYLLMFHASLPFPFPSSTPSPSPSSPVCSCMHLPGRISLGFSRLRTHASVLLPLPPPHPSLQFIFFSHSLPPFLPSFRFTLFHLKTTNSILPFLLYFFFSSILQNFLRLHIFVFATLIFSFFVSSYFPLASTPFPSSFLPLATFHTFLTNILPFSSSPHSFSSSLSSSFG